MTEIGVQSPNSLHLLFANILIDYVVEEMAHRLGETDNINYYQILVVIKPVLFFL